MGLPALAQSWLEGLEGPQPHCPLVPIWTLQLQQQLLLLLLLPPPPLLLGLELRRLPAALPAGCCSSLAWPQHGRVRQCRHGPGGGQVLLLLLLLLGLQRYRTRCLLDDKSRPAVQQPQ